MESLDAESYFAECEEQGDAVCSSANADEYGSTLGGEEGVCGVPNVLEYIHLGVGVCCIVYNE